jgi:hypothetical protein
VIYLECPECSGIITTKKISYWYRNQIYLGKFKAEICKKCGSIYFTEESFKEIEFRAKQLKIWGREFLNLEDKRITITEKNTNIINAREFLGKIPSFHSYINDMSVSVE